MPPVILRIDKEAFGVARICGGRSAHCTESFVTQQLVRIIESADMNEESGQIAWCRNPTTARIHAGDVPPVRIAWTIVFYLVGRSVLYSISTDLHTNYAAT